MQARKAAAVASGDDSAIDTPILRTLLRSSLRKYAKDLGLSTEDVLALEYAPALEPPAPGPSTDAPEWISALAGSERYAVAGLYDGTVSILDTTGLASSGSSGTTLRMGAAQACHAGPVTGLSLWESEAEQGRAASGLLASAGADGVVQVWSVSAAASAAASAKGSKASKGKEAGPGLALLHTLSTEHGAPCGAVQIDPTGERVAAGDGDGTVYVWSLKASDEADDGMNAAQGSGVSQKRRREESTAAAVEGRKADMKLDMIHSSGQQVSSVAWLGSGTLASGAWDHAIVLTDVEVGGTPVLTFRPGKVVTCLAASSTGGSLASGHPDGLVRLWDPRGRGSSKAGEDPLAGTSGGTVHAGLRGTLSTPAATTGSTWISSLAWCSSSSHLLAGTTYTGACHLWDVRALGAPLHSSDAQASKALASVWFSPTQTTEAVYVLFGGENKQVQSMRVSVPVSAGKAV